MSGWGPMRAHDGGPCPVVGAYVQVHCADGYVAEGVVQASVNDARCCSLWIWASICGPVCWRKRVVSYRVRREPQAEALIARIKALPAPSREGVDA